MKILALDTSAEFCTLALWLDGDVIVGEERAGRKHTELVLPMLQRMLAESGLGLGQLDGIAFGAGPGSFTGLRIACGVAQGLALGAGLPVVGVSTLEALAESAGRPQVIACLDARMGEIYHAAYRREDQAWRTVAAPSLCLPQDAPQVPGGDWIGCGSGFDAYSDVLRARYHGRLVQVIPGRAPHAREMARLAVPRFAAGEGQDPALAAPVYIRNKVALKESER